MNTVQSSSRDIQWGPVDYDPQSAAKDQAKRIALAEKMVAMLDVSIAANAYTAALTKKHAMDGKDSTATVRQEARALLIDFLAGKACIALTTEDMGHQLKIYEMDAIDTAKGAKRLRVLLKVFGFLFGKNTIKAVNSSKDKPLDPNAAASAMMVIVMVVITLMAARVF